MRLWLPAALCVVLACSTDLPPEELRDEQDDAAAPSLGPALTPPAPSPTQVEGPVALLPLAAFPAQPLPVTTAPLATVQAERMPEWPPLQTSLPHWKLEISTADLATLDATLDQEVPARLTVDGKAHGIEARFHGRSSRGFPKKSFRLETSSQDLIEGRKHFILLAMYQDGGYLTEKLWWDLAAASGVTASRARYVELELNGAPYGVMLDVESVDKRFLPAHGLDPASDIYRCGQKDCELRDRPALFWQEPWQKKTNETTSDQNLWDFLRLVNRTAEHRFEQELSASFEVNRHLRFLAFDALISTFTTEDSRSYLVQDAATRRWSYLPWDLNNSLAMYLRRNALNHTPIVDRQLLDFSVYDPWAFRVADDRQLPAAWSVLNTRIFDRPALLEGFARSLEWMLDGRFTSKAIDARLDAMDALLKPYRARDPWVDPAYAARSADYLKRYVKGRATFVRAALPALRKHGQTALEIEAFSLKNGEAEVELVNRTGKPISLQGLLLTADLKNPTAAVLPALTIGAYGALTLKLSDYGVRIDPAHLEVGLFRDARTAEDVLFLPAMTSGGYRRVVHGSGSSGPLP